jgi:hypothetical protein
MKIHNDFLKCRSKLNRFRSGIAWHKSIDGGDRAISSGKTKVQKPFPPGTVLVTDSKTTYKALDANINASDVKEDGDAFKIMIAATIQIPHHWLFGSGENTNLATAKNMSAVPKRKFLRRQKDIEQIVGEILWKAVQFYMVKNVSKSGILITKEMVLDKLKETVKKVKKNYDLDEFNYKGTPIKKTNLVVKAPILDEHNAEDILRLITAGQRMREAGIGSNHAVHELVGIDYKKDQELMELEMMRGDYETIKKVLDIFSKRSKAVIDTTNTLDINNDGVVDDTEEPLNISSKIDSFPDTLDKEKTKIGGA